MVTMTSIDYRNEAERATDKRIWKIKEAYNFDLNRIAAALSWAESCRADDRKNMDKEIRRAKLQARAERDQEFMQMVIDHPSGCYEGKCGFLKDNDLPVPTVTYTITASVTVEGGTDMHELCGDIEYAIDGLDGVTYSVRPDYEREDD